MKKILYLIILVLLASTCFAECDTGVIEIGRNGKRYCRSYGGSDARRHAFFSGMAWCYAQGYTPTTIHSACDYSATEKWDPSSTACPNFANWKSLKNGANQQHGSGERAVATLTNSDSKKMYRVFLNANQTDAYVSNAAFDKLGWFWCDMPN